MKLAIRLGVAVLLLAVTVAWVLTAVILLAAPFFYRILRQRGLIAMERLMGMLLVMISVQMLMNGVRTFVSGVLKTLAATG